MTCDSGRLRNGAKGLANALRHRATDASHEALLRGLRLSVGIAFAESANVSTVIAMGDLAKQLNQESTRDAVAANNCPATDK